MSIYVSNLSSVVDRDDLEELFAEYGIVKRVNLPMDRETGKKREFAFVEMETPEEEAKAIAALDGAHFRGRQLRVNLARSRDSNDPRF